MAYSPNTIAAWFIRRAKQDGEYLTQMKLQKLVYFSHGWNLAFYEAPLIDGRVEAWKWGPVIPSLYREFARFGSKPITEIPATKPKVSSRTSDLLESVWKGYRGLTAAQMSDLTHRQDTPWSDVYDDGVRHAEITPKRIKAHYKELMRKAEDE